VRETQYVGREGRERRGGSLNIEGEGLQIKCGSFRGWACMSMGIVVYEIFRKRERN
jgi:hypothetical protein